MIFLNWNTVLKSKSCLLFLCLQKVFSGFSEKFGIFYQGTYYLNMNHFTHTCPQTCTFFHKDGLDE